MTKELPDDWQSESYYSVNDASPAELRRLVVHLRGQVSLMKNGHTESGDDLLTPTEMEHATEAMKSLQSLAGELDERHLKELTEDADLASVADYISGVAGLSEDVTSELDDVAETINRTGWPSPNPHEIAADSAAEARRLQNELDKISDGSEDLLSDGGVPADVRDAIGGFDWEEPPRIIDSNGTRYAVGWTDGGWFNIAHVEITHAHDEWFVETLGEYPVVGFTRDNIDELLDAIESGL